MIEETSPLPEEETQAQEVPAAEEPALQETTAEELAQPTTPTTPDWIARTLSIVIPAVLSVLLFGSGLGVGWFIWGRPTPQPAAAAGAPADAGGEEIQIPEKLTRYDIPLDDDPSLGPDSAPITLVEFSDYQCPFCTNWHNEVFQRLMDEYDGKIRFVYRDFPLKSIHPRAVPAAEAANCAGEQNAYWPYHTALFGAEFGLGDDSFVQYAGKLGLDTASFQKCVDEHRYADEVESDFQYAAQMGIQSTPTFFINGIAIVGAQPFSVFKQVIDLELAGKLPK